MQNIENLTQILRNCITPVAMISGVGLLLLTMTNRIGRAIDRARTLTKELRESKETQNKDMIFQIKILYKRANILRISIIWLVSSMFSSALVVVSIFFIHMLNAPLWTPSALLFALSLMAIVISLAFFIFDVILSLKALKIDLNEIPN